MKTPAFVIIALSSATLLSADCPNGNCAYQGQSSGPYYQQGYQGQPSGQYYQQGNQGERSDQYNQVRSQQNYNQNSGQRPSANQDRDGYYIPSSSSNTKTSSYQSNSSSNSNPNNLNNSNNSSYVNDDKNAPKAVKAVSDEEIAKEVHEAVSSNWLSSGYPDVTFDVNNGTVNLRGFVKTAEEKTKLESAIKKIDGVKQVNNEISVGEAKTANNGKKNAYFATSETKIQKTEKTYPQDTAATDADRQINSKLRSKLSGWFTTGYETIVLNTSNGVVTITGFVEKTDDIQKINKDAKNIEGVKTVNNNVNVKKK